MTDLKVPAVMMAGGKAGDALAEHAGVPYKALVPIGGRPMAAHVMDALAASKTVSEVLLVAPAEVAAALPGARHLQDTDSFLGNIQAGVGACRGAEFCLLVTCDIPYVTGPILDAFVQASAARGVDITMPIVEMARCEERFPGMRRTSMRLREGRFTLGNTTLMRPAFLERNTATIEAAFAARKQPLRLAGMLGPGLILRVLLASRFPAALPLSYVENRIGKLVGGAVAAIPLPYPEIGADIDKPSDLGAEANG